MHFTPTYSSWLNQVERWFGLITQQAIRRGSFESVRQLISSIQRYVDQYNVHKRPFMWTATADSILEKISRLCKAISGTEIDPQKRTPILLKRVLSRIGVMTPGMIAVMAPV
jgi:putative transposase